jgi:PAS domain S-box-containing protein
MREGLTFTEQVEELRQRLEALLRRADARQRPPIMAAWEELSAVLEDLGAVGEELRRRNEEMAVTSERLETERQHYQQLFDLAPDGYVVTDAEGIIQEANRPIASLLHVRQRSLVDRQLADFIVPEERDSFDARLAQLRDRKVDKVPYWVLRMRAHDGAPFWAAISVASVSGSPDKPVSLRWLLRDITQRKWAEEALQQSEERYRTIVDNTQDGLTIIEDGRTVYVNDRACEIYGYSRDEYVRMTSQDFAAPEEKERLQRIVDEIRQTGAVPQELECWIVRKDGARRCIRNRYSRIQGKSDARLVVTTDITGRKRAAEALKRRAAQLALLNDIGGKISAVLDLDSVLYRAAHLVQESFGYHHVALFAVDHDQGELVMRARAGDFADIYPAEHRLKLGQGMVGWVGQSGKRLLANDVSAEPYYINLYPDVVPTRSELSVPLCVGDKIVGVLDIQSPELGAFDENDVMVMETLADQVAAAVENARLYEAVQQELAERKRAEEALGRRAAQLALLNDVGSKIAAVLDLEAVLDIAARLVQESFGYHHVGLFTLDRDHEELVMRAKAGDFTDLYPPEHRLKLGQGIVGWVGYYGKSLLANDVSVEPHYVNLYPDVVPTRSELSVPIGVAGEVVGVIDVQSPELDAFDENDVMVMETLADQIAAAVENARLYEAVQQELAERKRAEEALGRRAAQLALLNDIGGKIAAVLDLDSVLDRAAHLVRENFGYHHVGLFTLDREQEELVMRAKAGDFTDLYPPEHRLKLGQGIVGWVGQSCESLLANDVSAEPRYVNLYPDVVSTRSELSVPVCVGGQVVGVLDIQSPEFNAFDEDDVMVKETLANQIAVAIENARLYEALRESEARYRAVSELASDFAYAIRVDPDGTIEFDWVTEAFTHITGFTTDEVEDRGGWQSVIYPDDLPKVLEYLQERLSGQRNVAEYRIVTKDGSVRWLRDYGRPELDEAQDCVVCIYGAARDITERKHMIRTERLAAMGHMAAALTHEIKGPLQTLRDHLRLALDPALEPGEREERLRACQREIDQLTEIAEPVLGLAEPLEDVRRPVAIEGLVQQALALLDRPLQRANIQTITDFPADLFPVLVVPDQIVQALLNLMINAIEAMPEGGCVHVAARPGVDAAVLTLTNDGPPIPAEHVAYVFDPFFTTKSGDAGLGLYISQNIIEDHGGTIEVENLEEDQGVAFTVTLPIAPPALRQAPAEGQAPAGGRAFAEG